MRPKTHSFIFYLYKNTVVDTNINRNVCQLSFHLHFFVIKEQDPLFRALLWPGIFLILISNRTAGLLPGTPSSILCDHRNNNAEYPVILFPVLKVIIFDRILSHPNPSAEKLFILSALFYAQCMIKCLSIQVTDMDIISFLLLHAVEHHIRLMQKIPAFIALLWNVIADSLRNRHNRRCR